MDVISRQTEIIKLAVSATAQLAQIFAILHPTGKLGTEVVHCGIPLYSAPSKC